MQINQKTTWQRVTVVIVTHNSSKVIAQCLYSVSEAQEVIVVDNASTDLTCEEIRKIMPNAEIIENLDNRGFGSGVNQGLEKVKTEFGFCFSPDAILADGAMSDLIVAADKNPGTALFGPSIKRTDGNPEIYVMGPRELCHKKMDTIPAGQFCTWFIMGGFFLCRMSAWRHVGGFDKQIFLYVEDVDLSIRMVQANFSLMIVPEAEVIHFGGQSSKISWSVKWRKDWHQTWSRLYVIAKHGGMKEAKQDAICIFRQKTCKALLYALLLRPDRVRGNCAKALGALAFLRNRPSH